MNAFIVGAGFTNAIFPEAPLNHGLLDTLVGTFPNSASASLRDRYKTQDIEIALTRLDADIALSRGESVEIGQELRSLRRRIEGELADYFGRFLASENLLSHFRWLRQLIDDGFVNEDVAISLNYDCILEGLLDCGGKWSANGGYGSLDNPLACSRGQVLNLESRSPGF